MLTRTIYRQNEQPAQVNYIWLTTRLQHLTLDALKNGLYSMLENNNENIESFQDVITAEMPTEDDCRILHIDTREPLLVKTRKGYNDRGNWWNSASRSILQVAINILLRIVDELADTGKGSRLSFLSCE
ncbi:UTRA domain-containing protein [Klebsiella pneumoniae]